MKNKKTLNLRFKKQVTSIETFRISGVIVLGPLPEKSAIVGEGLTSVVAVVGVIYATGFL